MVIVYRFEVDVELVQFLLRIQSLDLIGVVRIGEVIMRKRYKNGHIEAASGEIAHSRRIANAARTEAPIVRVIGRVGEEAIRSSEPIR